MNNNVSNFNEPICRSALVLKLDFYSLEIPAYGVYRFVCLFHSDLAYRFGRSLCLWIFLFSSSNRISRSSSILFTWNETRKKTSISFYLFIACGSTMNFIFFLLLNCIASQLHNWQSFVEASLWLRRSFALSLSTSPLLPRQSPFEITIWIIMTKLAKA